MADELDISQAHIEKQSERQMKDAVAWAESITAEQATEDARNAVPAPDASGDGAASPADDRARQMEIYNQAAANFEAARGDIEAGRNRAYPDWATAQAALSKLHPDNQEPTWQKFVRNISPLEAMGGALDYADNAFETIRLMSAKGDQALMGMGVPALTVGPDGVGTTTNYDEFSKTKNVGDALPDIGDPNTPGFARGVGKFMAGYATAGQMLKGVQTVKTVADSGRLGASAVAALKGAISDFSGMRDLEGSLANLIQESPTLANPVAEFLSASDESPELVNKLKTAIVGAGFGMAVDGIFAGLRAVRAGRQVKSAAEQMDQVAAGLQREADTAKGMLSEVLGNPDDARLVIEAGDQAAQQGAEAGTATGFATAKGSTYQITPDGSTIRNKAARPDIGHEGQSGLQPKSEKTFYVAAEHADVLGEIQTQGGARRAIVVSSGDTHAAVKYLDGKDAGKLERRTLVPIQTQPAVGLTPVELWKDGERVHFGNPIVSVASDVPPKSLLSQPPMVENPNGLGSVYINWSRIDSPDDVKAIIQDLANRYSDSIDEARGGVQSFGDTEAAAGAEDAWKLLQERAKGQPLNAAQTLAVRRLWTASGAKVRDLAQRVEVGGSAADAIALKKMIAVHAAIQEQVIGIRTETARALSQWRIPAGESDQFMAGLQGFMAQMDADGSISTIARGINRLSDIGSPAAVDEFIFGASTIDQMRKAGVNTADAIRQLFYMSLLSGPKTHVRNSVSNTAMLLGEALSRRGAAYLGDLLGGQNVPDGEAAAMLYGQLNGALDAFRISPLARAAAEADGLVPRSPVMNALATGGSGLGVGKLEQPMVGAFEAAKHGVDPKSNVGRVMDFVDTATRIPTRMLAAEDEVFRTSAYMGEIHALSFRQATSEAASGLIADSEIATRAAELARDPQTGMRLMAQSAAEKTIFANRPDWDSKLYQMMRGIAKVPIIGKLAMPFTKTAYNISIGWAQWAPMAPATKRFRDEIMAGGARGDIAWTKFVVGNVALVSLADAAIKGHIIGADRGLGGSDVAAGQTATARGAGREPMTISSQNADGTVTSVGYRGLEPLSTSIGMAANLVEILSSDQFDSDDKEIDDLVIAASAAIATQVTQPSFMTGLSDILSFQSDPTRNAETFAERTAGILVPNAVAEVARAQDPIIRDVSGWMDAIKAKTPGLSKTLPANTDRWGRDLSRESGIGWAYDAISPFPVKRMKPEPVDLELERLEVGLAKPQKAQFFDGVKINMKMHPHEYTRFVKLAGNDLKQTVEGEPISVPSIGYESEGGGLMEELNAIVEGRHAFSEIYYDEMSSDGPDGDKAAFLGSIVNAFRNEARVALLKEYPGLRAKVAMRYEQMPERGFARGRGRDVLDRSE